MKKTNIFYWVFTGLFAFLMLGSAIPDIISHPVAIQGMHVELGYPLFFVPFIGVAKVLGAIAILVPGFPRLKEWAYAGLAFDIIGAIYSQIATGQSLTALIFPFVAILFLSGSYLFYHKRQRLRKENPTITV